MIWIFDEDNNFGPMNRLLLLFDFLLSAFAQPTLPEKPLERALARHQAGDIEGAIVDYRSYLAENPNAFEIRPNLGAALARVGRYEEAIGEYRKALEGSNGNSGIRLNLAYYKSGQLTHAAEELETLRAADPTNRQVLLLVAASYLRLDANPKVIELLAPLRTRGEDDLPEFV